MVYYLIYLCLLMQASEIYTLYFIVCYTVIYLQLVIYTHGLLFGVRSLLENTMRLPCNCVSKSHMI